MLLAAILLLKTCSFQVTMSVVIHTNCFRFIPLKILDAEDSRFKFSCF